MLWFLFFYKAIGGDGVTPNVNVASYYHT